MYKKLLLLCEKTNARIPVKVFQSGLKTGMEGGVAHAFLRCRSMDSFVRSVFCYGRCDKPPETRIPGLPYSS